MLPKLIQQIQYIRVEDEILEVNMVYMKKKNAILLLNQNFDPWNFA